MTIKIVSEDHDIEAYVSIPHIPMVGDVLEFYVEELGDTVMREIESVIHVLDNENSFTGITLLLEERGEKY